MSRLLNRGGLLGYFLSALLSIVNMSKDISFFVCYFLLDYFVYYFERILLFCLAYIVLFSLTGPTYNPISCGVYEAEETVRETEKKGVVCGFDGRLSSYGSFCLVGSGGGRRYDDFVNFALPLFVWA